MSPKRTIGQISKRPSTPAKSATPATPQPSAAYRALGASWKRSLRAENKAPNTIETYLFAHARFGAFLAERGLPQRPRDIRREHVEAWLVAMYDAGYAPGTVVNRYLGVHAWFSWLERDDEIAESPMRRMRTPRAPERLRPVLSDEEVTALRDACRGSSFADRRDLAILTLLFDTGMRRGDLVSITLDHLNLDEQCVLVTETKAREDRMIGFGRETTRVLDRYLRARASQLHSGSPYLFIGQHGRIVGNGVYWIITERAKRAGVADVHPHRFRHTYAHLFLEAGGQEGDLMAQAGWRSPKMVWHYGRALRAKRAREAAKRLSPADRMAAVSLSQPYPLQGR